MGWASGSSLVRQLIATIQENVGDPDLRLYIYTDLINAFEDADWDTQDEAMGIDEEFDRAIYQIHPDWKEDDED